MILLTIGSREAGSGFGGVMGSSGCMRKYSRRDMRRIPSAFCPGRRLGMVWCRLSSVGRPEPQNESCLVASIRVLG